MATRLIMSPSKSQTGPRSFTKALALAFNEWLLMLMLFANSIFSYVITKFADYTELESPCMMCTRLDLILERTKHSNKSHWDMICSKHKSEISSLVYCHAHGKLVDVRRMCETCLFSFATTNKSNAETYRLLVGKLGEDSSSCFESKTDTSTKPRYCTCCNQLWMAQTATQVAKAVAKPDTLAKIRVSGDVKAAKISTPKKSVIFNHLPHVGYTELKIHSDTESEAVFSEDEVVMVKEEDHKFQTMDLETPRGITLPYDLATDKLLSLDLPLVDRNGREEVHLKEIDLSTNAFSQEKKVLREEEIISLDNLFLTSRAMEDSSLVLEELIHLEDVSSTQVFKEVPTKTLMEETGLISVNSVPDSPVSALKEEEEIISLDNFFLTSRAMEHSSSVLKEVEDLIHLQDVDLTTDSMETSVKALTEEKDLICLNDVTSSSHSAETTEGEETVSIKKEELVHLQDTSSTTDLKENTAKDSTEETELICLKDVTSTSSEAAETPEDVLKGIELMSLHDISVPESFTTNETYVETPKESHTNQADIVTSMDSENIAKSPSNSMPENTNEKCVSETIERKETSITVSSVSEMASQAVTSHIEEAIESESSSFNSMSVTAETNIGSGEAWVQGGELLDLADAYNNIVHSESNKDSNGGAEIEQWMKKDTSRVSEDLKALLTQISASRGIEFLSPRDISPSMCSDQDTKNLDYDMQMLIQKRMLERNESNLSLEGVSVSEIEGESEGDRLKRQVDHDRKLLTGLYKELEEERSASAVATNQAMAMITRLQEEKSLFQMEALQNLRMMEEQAEYDMEAIQKLNDLLVEREKLIQDLEAEIDYFRDQSSQKSKKVDNIIEIDTTNERMSNKLQSCLSGFNEERLYITRCLEKIEKRVQVDVKGEANVDNLATQESVSELHERVEKLKGDLYFLEHVVSSLGHGDEGVEFVKEIASHLQTLRSISMKRQEHTET